MALILIIHHNLILMFSFSLMFCTIVPVVLEDELAQMMSDMKGMKNSGGFMEDKPLSAEEDGGGKECK